MMKVVLELQGQRSNIKKVTVRHDVVIGRATECNLRVSSPQVSRRHCFLRVRSSGVTITDLESSNGTWLNGEKIVAGKSYPVDDGTTLNVGHVQFVARVTSAGLNDGPIHLTDEPAIAPSLIDSASMDFSIEHAGPSAEEDEPTVDYSSGYAPRQQAAAEKFAEAVDVREVEPAEVVDVSAWSVEAIDADAIEVEAVDIEVEAVDVEVIDIDEAPAQADEPTHFPVVEDVEVVDVADSAEDLLVLEDVEVLEDVIELNEDDIEVLDDVEAFGEVQPAAVPSDEFSSNVASSDAPGSDWFQLDDEADPAVDAELEKFLKGQ